ncbi:MAG TPA: hypothetical protein ENN87_03855 [Phycisphaerales bacterium]|nr:hypothetical protein [Phycisphaerales bacterium]
MDGQRTFGQDVEFLKEHTDAIVLSDAAGRAQLAVVPAYQGRVMTSTAEGPDGLSFGWLNYELIASGQVLPHMNAFGGEDRFWLGPEGGQYALFFKPGDPFDFEHWQTPAIIDTEPFEMLSRTRTTALFGKRTTLTNYAGTTFDVEIQRAVTLLDAEQAALALNTSVPRGVRLVAYQTENRITNAGSQAWTKAGGLLSIWILGMYKPSPQTTMVIPFRPGPEAELGPIVNDAYFGKVPSDRLVIKDGVLFFKGDGQYRSKIGLSPQRALPVLGSYDAANHILTIVQYNKPEGVMDYVNSMWELQDEPYRGDVVNSYNDGPPEPGAKPLGPFYELETSSPAAALRPGETLGHRHRTIHLQGSEASLDPIARHVLGVSLEEIRTALP